MMLQILQIYFKFWFILIAPSTISTFYGLIFFIQALLVFIQ